MSLEPPRSRRARLLEHLALLLAFLATRLALYAAGLRFNFDLRWMFLSDLGDLRERLFETVFHFHAFPPGMNLITGVLLRLSPEHAGALAAGLFWAFGGLLTASLHEIFRALGSSRVASMALALAFSLLPQTLYLENLYLYTYLCACLLCAGAVLFVRALGRGTAWSWFGFFAVCAALGWLYTVFHLAWFLLMVAFALACWALPRSIAPRGSWRALALGAALPGLLLFGLYAKNYVVFGVFGATSWGPANMTLATTQQMRPAERNQWIREGKLSPFAAINVYSPPSAYLRLLPEGISYPWPGTNELERPSVSQGNYNHGLFLDVHRVRREDVARYLEERPGSYLRRVLNHHLPSFFHSTTRWHPRDRSPASPHAQHRAVLGGYEALYERLVHGWPAPKVGLYVLLPLFVGWAAWAAVARLRSREPRAWAGGALLAFCLFQIAFVSSASVLFTSWETSRYRYSIEPFNWVIVAGALGAAFRQLRRRAGALRGARPEPPAAVAGPSIQALSSQLDPRQARD